MPTCSRCGYHFRTLEDEQDIHSCPRCGLEPRDNDMECKCDTCFWDEWDINLTKCPPIKNCEVIKGIGVTQCPNYRIK
jgi:hypothetical protein